MAKVRVELDSDGMRELLQDPDVADDLMRRAEDVAAMAEAIVPEMTGELRESIFTRLVHHDDGRVVAQCFADAPHAGVVEAHTNFLKRSLDAGLG